MGLGPWIRGSDGAEKKMPVLFLRLYMKDPGVLISDAHGPSHMPRCQVHGQPPSNICASCIWFSHIYLTCLFHPLSWVPHLDLQLPSWMEHREFKFSWICLPNLHILLYSLFQSMVTLNQSTCFLLKKWTCCSQILFSPPSSTDHQIFWLSLLLHCFAWINTISLWSPAPSLQPAH